ncbi:MAG TPA: hypothetical protein VGD24_05630 [Gallionella sp.]
MKALNLPLKGIGALLLSMSLTACLNPFDKTNDTTSTTNGGGSTNGVSCDLTSFNTAALSQCITFNSASGVTSCATFGSSATTVASCTGTNSCVYADYTTYYSGTDAALVQTGCTNAGGTWY